MKIQKYIPVFFVSALASAPAFADKIEYRYYTLSDEVLMAFADNGDVSPYTFCVTENLGWTPSDTAIPDVAEKLKIRVMPPGQSLRALGTGDCDLAAVHNFRNESAAELDARASSLSSRLRPIPALNGEAQIADGPAPAPLVIDASPMSKDIEILVNERFARHLRAASEMADGLLRLPINPSTVIECDPDWCSFKDPFGIGTSLRMRFHIPEDPACGPLGGKSIECTFAAKVVVNMRGAHSTDAAFQNLWSALGGSAPGALIQGQGQFVLYAGQGVHYDRKWSHFSRKDKLWAIQGPLQLGDARLVDADQ